MFKFCKNINLFNKLKIIQYLSIILPIVFLINSKLTYSQDFHEVGLTVAGNNLESTAKKDYDKSNTVTISVSKESSISISIYNKENNLVKLFKYNSLMPGLYEFDIKSQLQIGEYICKINTGEISETFPLFVE